MTSYQENLMAEQIYEHPDNPRKNLGDLTELTESIRKNGIMQNMTVVPGHWMSAEEKRATENELLKMIPEGKEYTKLRHEYEAGYSSKGYTLLIGHRRFAAGKAAGVEVFPCRVATGLSHLDQVGIMLEENMQRNDLTIMEQANGFQMMLDLGDTPELIAEKTGFSKTTVYHRLNIAKLDQKELKKKEENDGFQLSLKDLYELEKIDDMNTRNKVLKEAFSSADLATRAKSAAQKEKWDKTAENIKEKLEGLGIREATKKEYDQRWSAGYIKIKEYDLDQKPPVELNLKKPKEKTFWIQDYRVLTIYTKPKNQERQLSSYEKAQKEKKAKKKQIKTILKRSDQRRKELIESIISKEIEPAKDVQKTQEELWNALLQLGSSLYASNLYKYFLEKEYYESTEEEISKAKEKARSMSMTDQMLIMLDTSMKGEEPFDYNVDYKKEKGQAMLEAYDVLKKYGWYFEDDEEEKVLDGTSEIYKKEVKE